MLLRASGEATGTTVDIDAVVDEAPDETGIPGARAIARLVDASVRNDDTALPAARARVIEELGRDALHDAAAVIGNFERMNRIADAAGIPLDGITKVFGATDGERLGFSGFANAEAGTALGRVVASIADVVAPAAFRLMAFAGGKFSARRRSKRDASR